MSEYPLGASQQINSLDALIGGSLEAIIKAHILSVQSSLDFMLEAGFESERNQKVDKTTKTAPASRKLRMVEFTYTQPVPDPANPGSVIDTPAVVKVPLLTLVSIPRIAITEATMDFDVKILDIKPQEPNPWDILKLKPSLSLKGVFATRSGSEEDKKVEPSTLHISIKLKREVAPETEKRIFALLQDAIVARKRIEQKVSRE